MIGNSAMDRAGAYRYALRAGLRARAEQGKYEAFYLQGAQELLICNWFVACFLLLTVSKATYTSSFRHTHAPLSMPPTLSERTRSHKRDAYQPPELRSEALLDRDVTKTTGVYISNRVLFYSTWNTVTVSNATLNLVARYRCFARQ